MLKGQRIQQAMQAEEVTLPVCKMPDASGNGKGIGYPGNGKVWKSRNVP